MDDLTVASDRDGKLLEAISGGQWAINGFRNRDVRALLYPHPASSSEQRRAGQVTRSLSLLRAHGLIKKVTGTHRYLLTSQGTLIITALQAARRANVVKLTSLAA